MNITDKKLDQLLIISLTPYFLEKEVFWFQENLESMLKSAKTQSFFQDNILFLKNGEDFPTSQLIRKLDEMGYEKVFSVESPGEFSQIGGIVEVFPINMNSAVRLDFLGNTVDRIDILDITIKDEKTAKELLHKKLKSQKLFSDIKNIKAGDFLVHLDHGVGKFKGIEKINEAEYYVLEYAKDDRLFVPINLERKLSRYVGFADPVVARLGSSIWQTTKRKIKEQVEKLAKELLEMYAKKEIALRRPYVVDEELESQFKQGFAYEETKDQAQAVEEIKGDLVKEKPMDRLVLGDVGFGKTEVAMRTALLAASNNYQAAVICPTTILASQHYNNFKKRFGNLPVKIVLLSRLQTATEQKKILKDIKEGNVDIIIGTHRILSADIEFKKLQLLIIDDEQKFGVKQKEKLRSKIPSLDILSLSATPIPRTIYLSISSFKNISFIHTPPEGRIAPDTYVIPYDPKEIKKAIEVELARGGQVYFLHNRVETIDKVKHFLEELVPGIKAAYIHGRMQEKELVTIMDGFQKNSINVLVATTIIENGIDLANVNTIIIEDASRLGLSQAHQIRGRVGRSFKKSYAYMFYPKKMPPLAKERLKALEELNELGSGYQIAMRDLELRGAGNILGKEQSGNINKIGLNLYCQMLAESVEKMRAQN